MIRYQHKLIEEGNIGGKQQTHFMKGKCKHNYKDRSCTNGPSPRQGCLDEKTKLKTRESSNSWKDHKKKTCLYFGKTGYVEKTYWKKSADL